MPAAQYSVHNRDRECGPGGRSTPAMKPNDRNSTDAPLAQNRIALRRQQLGGALIIAVILLSVALFAAMQPGVAVAKSPDDPTMDSPELIGPGPGNLGYPEAPRRFQPFYDAGEGRPTGRIR